MANTAQNNHKKALQEQRWEALDTEARALFALAYNAAQTAQSQPETVVPQGFWHSLARHKLCTHDTLQHLAAPGATTRPCHRMLQKCRQRLHSSDKASLLALRTVLEYGPRFGQKTPQQMVQILLLVAQTLRPGPEADSQAIQKYNYDLAVAALPAAQESLRPPPVAPPPATPSPKRGFTGQFPTMPAFDLERFRQRPDEQGQRLSTRTLDLWHASHKGPEIAAKAENQDATWAQSAGEHVVFALADGVSTSLGARMAAAVAARSFVERAARVLGQDPSAPHPQEILEDAAAYAQLQLEHLLEEFRAAPQAPAFAALRGPMQAEVAARLLENTLSRRKNWGPALATTLLGGIALWQPQTRARQIHLAGLGDGVVERFDAQRQLLLRELTMDADVTAIEDALMPGPLGQASLRNLSLLPPVVLHPQDWLLLSSDGLARGHTGMVGTILQTRNCWPANNNRDNFAWHILQLAADTADHQETTSLFADNLSLIIINAK